MDAPAKNKKIVKSNVRKNVFVIGMLLVPVVHFIIFWGAVNFNSILMAFQRLDPLMGEFKFTLQNFKEFPLLWQFGGAKTELTNTFLTFGLLILLLPWGFFLTYFLYKKIALSGLWRTMLFVPTILPAVAVTTIFTYLINVLGPVGAFRELIGAKALHFLTDVKLARWTILAYVFWTNFGGQFILFSGAMSRIPKELIESSRLDGAKLWTEMLRIVLPLCWPTFSMLLLLNIAGLFTASGPVLLLTKGYYETSTVAFHIFNHTLSGFFNEPAALGVACTAILFPIILFSRWLLNKVYANVEF